MIKKNMWKIILSSFVILLPMIFGFCVWNILPESMAVHWGILGEPDGYAGVATTVIFLPLLLVAIHLVCVFMTAVLDKRNAEDQSPKIINLAYSLIPMISLFVFTGIYATAFGAKINMLSLASVLFGVLFIVIGNYMPKARRNSTFGIKISWTLANDENWNATHRFSAKIYLFGGVLIFFTAFLPPVAFAVVFTVIMIAMIAVPITYSYLYYKRAIREGRATEADYTYECAKSNKLVFIVSMVLVAAILIGVGVLMVTGDVSVEYGEASFAVDSIYADRIEIGYDTVDSIELRDGFDFGTREFGFGSPRLLMGLFTNDEFGRYTLYAYTNNDSVVILHIGDSKLVIGGADETATRAIYDSLLERCS